MSFPTKFTEAIAVETWDANFRWRAGDELRDRTIDATWRRVASAVAAAEGHDADPWEQRFVQAFQNWRIVPDARLLKWAGTGHDRVPLDSPRATLNLSAFVLRKQTSQPGFDYPAFSAAAALATRFLDDARLTYGDPACFPDICVGVMGFADALAALGYSYMGPRAGEFADALGEAMAMACREASLLLAQERGPYAVEAETSAAATERSSSLRRSNRPRHARTTAIHTQHLVALLANHASDALDPLVGSAWDVDSRWELRMRTEPLDTPQMLLQQIELRGRLQPWIDAPIDYPLVYSGDRLDPSTASACRRLAHARGLPTPRFRRCEQPLLNPVRMT